MTQTLFDHLRTGLTNVARAWAITRRDGVVLGFTDHDRPLMFEGITFRADGGMTAKAIVQGTGLAVDNTEAMGVLSDPSISDADISAGRYDGAAVQAWIVNWRDPSQRVLRFSGSIGEIRRSEGAFTAELRGQSEALNQPAGRAFLKTCSAVLGDEACGISLLASGIGQTLPAEVIEGRRVFRFVRMDTFDRGWFERGRLTVMSGAAIGQVGLIKVDGVDKTGSRVIELWHELSATVAPGDLLRVEAGCNKRMETCRTKFNNLVNFQGFPDIPGEDWLMGTPLSTASNDGGSLR